METCPPSITRDRHEDGNDKPYDIFSYTVDGQRIGHVYTYDHSDTRLHIDEIEVDAAHRRRGIGRALLHAVKEHADPLYEQVTATIVSRECLQAMRRVYGDDAVTVRKEGEFDANNPQRDTSARLLYRTPRHH